MQNTLSDRRYVSPSELNVQSVHRYSPSTSSVCV